MRIREAVPNLEFVDIGLIAYKKPVSDILKGNNEKYIHLGVQIQANPSPQCSETWDLKDEIAWPFPRSIGVF